jgi:hypothetical protein
MPDASPWPTCIYTRIHTYIQDFHPHGLSLMPRLGLETKQQADVGDGKTRIYTVSHTREGDVVEILEAHGASLRHIRTIHSPLWSNLNGIAATKSGFYATNWVNFMPYSHPLAVPELLGLGTEMGLSAFVVYCHVGDHVDEDAKCHVVADTGMSMVNGVEVSADGKLVYVIESIGKRCVCVCVYVCM